MTDSMQDESSSPPQELIRFNNPAQSTALSAAYPWYSLRTRSLTDPILRMHNEAIQFHLYLAPTPQIHLSRIALLQDLAKNIQNQALHCLLIAPFLTSQLYLRGTELEIILLVPNLKAQLAAELQDKLSVHLQSPLTSLPPTGEQYPIFEYETTVGQHSIILRLMERLNWQQFFNSVGEINSQIPQLKFVFFIISCMIRQRTMQTAIRPHLLFALLAVFYHQRRKHKHRTLTENVIKFVEYYGAGPFAERRINYLGRGRYELQPEGPFSLWIDQQTNASNNKLRDLFSLLKNRYRLLSNYNFLGERSILGSLVNPNGGEFEYL